MLIIFWGCGQSKTDHLETLDNSSLNNTKYSETYKKLYPDWFWNMPYSEDSIYAVGYSETSSLHPENSELSAIEDGIKTLACLLSVNIKAEHRQILGEGLNIIDKSKEIEEIGAGNEDFVRNNYQIIKKFVSSNHTLFLMKIVKEGNQEPETTIGSAIIPPKPSWVTRLPKEPNYIYATGESSLYYREIESWRNAEKKARIALAFSFEAKIKGMSESLDGETLFTSSTSTNIHLNDIQIISRWKDEGLNSCHILIRMKEPTGVLWKKIE